MKALSIKQPWASLIAHGIKDIENRTWKTNFRGRVFIHASAKWDERSNSNNPDDIFTWTQRKAIPDKVGSKFLDYGVLVKDDETPVSAIIGEVDIVDCVINHQSIWAEISPFCPVTGLKHFASITNEDSVFVETYGGPFDSYTIPIQDPDDPKEFTRTRYCHDRGEWRGDEMISKKTGIPKDRKPIYNWVLANPVIYEKPILNVKGKLSFWEPDIIIEECIGCSGNFDYETMQQDSAGENYCSDCAKEMFPLMKAEYDEMVRKGEIEE
ncbi:ASCH domain-containing protein [Epilithonimonas caeni]|uniref:ASCH domain-containing protein n=1 Tax=Epilithonimonas caeni TaxID=365343 RepID=UPI00041AA4FE|nr:ASCH domain-containing protein [Epilithonimonas caeni]